MVACILIEHVNVGIVDEPVDKIEISIVRLIRRAARRAID
jgi:hypothetical protein